MQEEQKTQVPETNQPVTVESTKEKMSKKQIIGMTILSLIAIAGVAFGIFGMNSQNQEIERLKVQVTEASGQKTELETDQITITDKDGTTTEITDTISSYHNPVIKSPGKIDGNNTKNYHITYESSPIYKANGEIKKISINVKDGKIDYCSVYDTESFVNELNCEITGLSGEIYKIIEFGAGHENSGNQIGFIMTDGAVQYLPLYDSVLNNDFRIRGKLGINGYIVDAVDISVHISDGEDGSGYRASAIVLNDGSVIEYNESMLK